MTRVFLFRGQHPLYETLISNPPTGIEYVSRPTRADPGEYSLYRPSSNALRQLADGCYGFARMPRVVPILKTYDLVHSSRGFIVIGPNNYVVDLEHAASFVGMRHHRMLSKHMRRVILKFLTSSRCCWVLPHCEAAMDSLSIISPDPAVSHKSRVVYPAFGSETATVVRGKRQVPTILYMGEYFWKGGRELLRACFRLSSKQDFKVKYISLRVHPPEAVLKKARETLDIEYIEGPIPRVNLLERVYPSTDIFAMPSYIDTFGYAFLEAMAHGIPCIGTNHFAIPEIIEHNVTGLVVDTSISYFDAHRMGHPEIRVEDVDNSLTVDELTKALSILLESSSLRESMGKQGRKEIVEGKFSVTRRNEILREVYESCMSR